MKQSKSPSAAQRSSILQPFTPTPIGLMMAAARSSTRARRFERAQRAVTARVIDAVDTSAPSRQRDARSDPDLCIETALDIEAGAQAMAALLARHRYIRAVFCSA